MSDAAGSIVVAFNGEIYNHGAVREDLEARGHRFRTRSDTEAIIHGYLARGPACLDGFHGMFAIAIWDARRRELVLVRDRFGIKPLFYALTEDGVVFASELKALLAGRAVGRRLDQRSLARFLALGYTPGPDTILEGVRQIPPGHYLRVRREGHELVEWWAPPLAVEDGRTAADCARGVAERLEAAVDRHLVSDVPVGLLLSGGLDSSSVLAFMRQRRRGPVQTFTAAFDEAGFDEGPEARRAAGAFGAHHDEVRCSPAWVLDHLEDIVTATDNLLANPAAIPLHQVTRHARSRLKVLLSGNGGDEVFLGYPTYVADRLLRCYQRVPAVLHVGLVRPLARRLPVSFGRLSLDYRLKQFVEGVRLPPERAHHSWRVIFPMHELRELLREADVARDSFEAFQPHFDRTRGEPDFVARAVHCDLGTWLADMALPMFDGIGMANSVEIRVPLLDHALVEYCLRIPMSVRMPGLRRKHLLKQAMTGRLDRRILRRAKAGFHVPLAEWLCGELRDLLLDRLHPDVIRRLGYLRPERVTRLCEEHLARRRDNSWRLWNLVCFVVWHERVLGRA